MTTGDAHDTGMQAAQALRRDTVSLRRLASSQSLRNAEEATEPLLRPLAAVSTLLVEETEAIRKRQQQRTWTLDRGAGYYQQERIKSRRPYLVETGR